MEHISELTSILKVYIKWHKSHLTCLVMMVYGFIMTKSVNLAEIAGAMPGDILFKSKYKRVQRFVANFQFDITAIVKIVFAIFPLAKKNITLAMDRTEWDLGKTRINILFLAIVYKETALPIIWKVLGKKGTSNTFLRIELLKKVLKVIPKDKIFAFTGDREFIGEEWITFLFDNEIPFYIRTRNNIRVNGKKGFDYITLKDLIRKAKQQDKYIFKGRLIFGCYLTIVIAKKSIKNDPMIIITNSNPKSAIRIYKRRWGIETMFGNFKTRGFNLENTCLCIPERVERLIFVLAIAFCWSLRVGEMNRKHEPIGMKKHNRKERSFFRKGLDKLRGCLFYLGVNIKEFLVFLNVFKKPKHPLEVYIKEGFYVLSCT